MPRSKQPTLSPARPSSISLRNISTPVQVVLVGASLSPMISTSSPTLTDATLDTTGGNRSTTFDRENVLDRHQERLVLFALRLRNVRVNRIHQLGDALAGLGSAGIVVSRQSVATDDRNVVTGEVVLVSNSRISSSTSSSNSGSSSPRSHLLRKTTMAPARQPDGPATRAPWFAASGHRLPHDQDSAVHLGGTGDHVLDKVGVTGQSMWA
jgi:hypothetical protein